MTLSRQSDFAQDADFERALQAVGASGSHLKNESIRLQLTTGGMRPGRRLRLTDACVSHDVVAGLNELQRWILAFNELAFNAAGLFVLNAGATALAGGTIDLTLHEAMHANASALFKSSLRCPFFFLIWFVVLFFDMARSAGGARNGELRPELLAVANASDLALNDGSLFDGNTGNLVKLIERRAKVSAALCRFVALSLSLFCRSQWDVMLRRRQRPSGSSSVVCSA